MRFQNQTPFNAMEAKEEIKMLRSALMDFMNYHKMEKERLDRLEAEIAALKGERDTAGIHPGRINTPGKNVYMRILKKK